MVAKTPCAFFFVVFCWASLAFGYCKTTPIYDHERQYVACYLDVHDERSGLGLVREFSAAQYTPDGCRHFCAHHRVFPVAHRDQVHWIVKSHVELDRMHAFLQRAGINMSPIAFYENLEQSLLDVGDLLSELEQARLWYDLRRAIDESMDAERQAPQETLPASAYARVAAKAEAPNAEGDCAICREPLFDADGTGGDEGASDEVLELLCGGKHYFHRGCIEPWGARSARCPLCRYSFAPAAPPPLRSSFTAG